MAEHERVLREIKRLPPELHLFCPRQTDQDLDRYEDGEGADEDAVRLQRIAEAKQRRKRFVLALQVLTYNGPDVEIWEQHIRDVLSVNLGRCDVCIKEYYVAKIALKQELLEFYEEEQIQQFFEIIDHLDIERIKTGLGAAARSLLDLPEAQRKVRNLGDLQLHAIFEALACDAFLDDADLLDKYFEEPFRLVQTTKPLVAKQYSPAVTKFLFSSNPLYFNWARTIWLTRLDRGPSEREWLWAIKNTIQRNIRQSRSPEAIGILWQALYVIVRRLDTEQITHKLYDIQPDICMTMLDHFSNPSVDFRLLLRVLSLLLENAPDGFWQAMGSISASTVAEQIFGNPLFDEKLQGSTWGEKQKYSKTSELFWIEPFMNSLQVATRPQACRAIASQLCERIRSENITTGSKSACYDALVKLLKQTVTSFSGNETTQQSATRLVLSETLNVIGDNMDLVLEPRPQLFSQDRSAIVRSAALEVVYKALSLECQCLKADFDDLRKPESNRSLAETSSCTTAIWNAVIRNLHTGDIELASMALDAVKDLPGLEKFRPSKGSVLSATKEAYNKNFDMLTGMLSGILERLYDFETSDLNKLYMKQDISSSLIAALFSADSRTYQAAVDLIKHISGQSGRQEALSHLLNAYLEVTVSSIHWTMKRIHTMATFASVPGMLKTGMEVLDVLCNAQTGILRARTLTEEECSAVQLHWSCQWAALDTVFKYAEKWFNQVHDTILKREMCRDAMQYAEALFDQYDVVASAILTAMPALVDDIPRLFLDGTSPDSILGPTRYDSPATSFRCISQWLRLKDEYLADTAVKLLTKMLYRLAGQIAHIDPEALEFVQGITRNLKPATVLSAAQKTDLARAINTFKEEQHKLQNAMLGIKTEDEIGNSETAGIKREDEFGDSDMAGIKKENDIRVSELVGIKSEDEFGDSDVFDSDLVELSTTQAAELGLTKTTHESQKPQPRPKPSNPSKPQLLAPTRMNKQLEAKAFIESRRAATEARKARERETSAKLRGVHGVGQHTKGQGSGLEGIGIRGKDHRYKADNMMVSSDSESSSEDSADERDNRLFSNPTHSSKPAPGPTRKPKAPMSQKDMRSRLAPDLSTLHKTILGWDFFAETDLPPNSDKQDYALVTNTFGTPQEYQRTFEPLLILESWQAFRAAREDSSLKAFGLTVSNQTLVNNFVEIKTTLSIADGKSLGIAVADVILLSKTANPADAQDHPHCLARVKQISYKKGDMEITYSVNSAPNTLRPHLSVDARIWGTHVLSLTPLEREYSALMALPYYDLYKEILRAEPSPLLNYSDSQLSPYIDKYQINQAQANAVKSALDNDGFTLIQGPPGSGKSSTICALVGAIIGSARTKKILVCAPSNAAVDELVMRFKAGVKMPDGATEQISVVRLGRSDAINSGVKDVTLEEMVNARLGTGAPKEPTEDIYRFMKEHKETSNEVNDMVSRFSNIRARGDAVEPAQEKDLDGLKRKRKQLSEKIDKIRDSQKTAARDADFNRKQMQQEILNSAHVLCATLSGSGHDIFQSFSVEFETVIVDEAAQCIELSALIPLKYGCLKCILVGDPKQLPPTVLSREAAAYQYEQSLFARMEKNHPKRVHLLDTQYRMHPEISLFPNKTFYDSRLKDGPDIAKLRARPWHQSRILAAYRFFDVQGLSSAASKGHSLINTAEIDVAMQLYQRLVTDYGNIDFAGKVGIITPYKGQLKQLRAKFSSRHGEDILTQIEFNTTDAFQGRECDIIIFSCVRASTKGIGFLKDIRRMNVGLTRAKCSLWVLGNSQALSQGAFWKALLQDARARDLYTGGDVLNLLRRPLLTADMMKDDVGMVLVEDMDDDHDSTLLAEKAAMSKPTPSQVPFPGISISTSSTKSDALTFPTMRSTTPHTQNPSSINSEAPVHPPFGGLITSPTQDPPSPVSGGKGGRRSKQPLRLKPRPRPAMSGQVSSDSRPSTSSSTSLSTVEHEGDRLDRTERRNSAPQRSGGHNGLNPNQACGRCGSTDHFTSQCDNERALADTIGTCHRCQTSGHLLDKCVEPRCLGCGMFGHSEPRCTAAPEQRLSGQEKANVERQERKFQERIERSRKKRAEKRSKRVTEDPYSIPTIRLTQPGEEITDMLKWKRQREEQAQSGRPGGPKAARVDSTPSRQAIGVSHDYQRHPLPAKPPTPGYGDAAKSATPGYGDPAQPDQARRPPHVPSQGPRVQKRRVKDDDLFLKKR